MHQNCDATQTLRNLPGKLNQAGYDSVENEANLEEQEIYIKYWSGISLREEKRRDHLKDLHINNSKTLKWILEKLVVKL
jgi:hypothetical protein